MEVDTLADPGDTIEIYYSDISLPILYSSSSRYRFYLDVSGNTSFVRFKTNQNFKVGTGFKVTYQAVDITSNLLPHGKIVTLSASDQEMQYVENAKYDWAVQAESGTFFVDVFVENIQTSTLSIYDSSDASGTNIFSSGASVMAFYFVEPTNPEFFVKFTAGANVYAGYSVTFYKGRNTGEYCNGIIYDIDLTVNSTISSPNYGTGFYNQNENCTWFVSAQPNHYIRMNLSIDFMGSGDSIFIFDDHSIDIADALYKSVGSSYMFGEFMSHGPNVAVQFTSDANTLIGKGFTISFEQVPIVDSTPPALVQSIGMITKQSGVDYGGGMDYNAYLSTANPSTVWFIETSQSSIDSNDDLFAMSYIGGWSGTSYNEGNLEAYGYSITNYTSTSGQHGSMIINFYSGFENQNIKSIFIEMNKTSTTDDCPSTPLLLTAPSGTIEMGRYTARGYTCKWQISLTPGQAVILDLDIFHTDFGKDQIGIYEGTGSNGTLITANPSLGEEGVFTSLYHEVYIEFIVDNGYSVGTGFNLTYRAAMIVPFMTTSDAGSLLWESQDWSAQASYTQPLAPIAPSGHLRLSNYINQGALWSKSPIPQLPNEFSILVDGVNRKVLGGPGLGVYLVPGSVKSTPYLLDYSVDRANFKGLGVFFDIKASVVYAISSETVIAVDSAPCGDTGSLPTTCPAANTQIGGKDQEFRLTITWQNNLLTVLYCIEGSCKFALLKKATNGLLQNVATAESLYFGITSLGVAGSYDYIDVSAVTFVVSEDTCAPACSANGICFNTVCQCQNGWTGSTCSSPICSQTCQNGGTCSGPDTCSCVAGFLGRFCEHPTCSGDRTINVDPTVSTSGYVAPDSYLEEEYFENQNCAWVISSTDPSYIVTFHLVTGTIDDNDLITVSSNGQQILQTSGDHFKIFMATDTSSIRVTFVTDGNGLRGSGFRLDYILEPAPANPQISGYLNNHEYESERYWANQDQTVLLSAAAGYSFSLDLSTDAFFNPQTETVLIYDGSSNGSPLIVNESRTDTRVFYTATSNSLLINFISDAELAANESFTGFKLKFVFHPLTPACSTPVAVSDSGGVVMSEGFPIGNYKSNENCTWTIDVSFDLIWLEFQTGFMDQDADIVTIYDGSTTSDPILIQTSSDNITFATISNSSVILVTFSSDAPYRTGNGWQINYIRVTYSSIFSYNNADLTYWNVKVPYAATPTVDGSGAVVLLQQAASGVASSASMAHSLVRFPPIFY